MTYHDSGAGWRRRGGEEAAAAARKRRGRLWRSAVADAGGEPLTLGSASRLGGCPVRTDQRQYQRAARRRAEEMIHLLTPARWSPRSRHEPRLVLGEGPAPALPRPLYSCEAVLTEAHISARGTDAAVADGLLVALGPLRSPRPSPRTRDKCADQPMDDAPGGDERGMVGLQVVTVDVTDFGIIAGVAAMPFALVPTES